MRNRVSFLPVVAGTLALAGLGLGLVACSDDGGSEEDQAAVQASIDAINQASIDGDTSSIDQVLTDDGAANIFGGSSVEDIKADPSIIAVESEDEFFVAEEINVDGDTAEAIGGFPNSAEEGTAPFQSGGTVVKFIKDGEQWKADGLGTVAAEEPEGANTVEVTMNEFAFEWDDAQFESGAPVFFELKNEGEQTHEIVMFKLPEEGELEELLASEDEVEGFIFQGFAGTFAAGEDSAAAYTENLEPGRYAFVCFLPDTSKANPADQLPHFMLGMAREITVQ